VVPKGFFKILFSLVSNCFFDKIHVLYYFYILTICMPNLASIKSCTFPGIFSDVFGSIGTKLKQREKDTGKDILVKWSMYR
jgi:hypothetical protein